MHKPQRKCIGCGRICDQELLIRVTFDGEKAVIDNDKKNPGRSVYLCNTDKCLEKALKKKAFERGLKREIKMNTLGGVYSDR